MQVLSVDEGYNASEAGVQVGDIILAIDGERVAGTPDVMRIRRNHIIGDSLTLTLLRDGQTFDVTVVMRSSK